MIERETVEKVATGTIRSPVVPAGEFVASRKRTQGYEGRAPYTDLKRGITKVERYYAPVDFPATGLRADSWIRFDLPLAQQPVYEDSGRPPADVVLFVGEAASDGPDSQKVGLLLCGSVQHLRTHGLPPGRMGSDTSWLHKIVLELDRREREDGLHTVPEFLTDIVPSRSSIRRREEIASQVHYWVSREHPVGSRSRMCGHAVVLMDIDRPGSLQRLVVASPLYVEVPAVMGRSRRTQWWRRRPPRSTPLS